MSDAEAVYAIIIGSGTLIGVMTPIIKLNNSITKLTTTLEYMRDDNLRQDDRLDNHSQKLDDHEKRLTKLEK